MLEETSPPQPTHCEKCKELLYACDIDMINRMKNPKCGVCTLLICRACHFGYSEKVKAYFVACKDCHRDREIEVDAARAIADEKEKKSQIEQSRRRLAYLLNDIINTLLTEERRNELIKLAVKYAKSGDMLAGYRFDPKEGHYWPVVYIVLPTGQVAWHLPRALIERRLNIEGYDESVPSDGHTTEERNKRCVEYVKDMVARYGKTEILD
jgi:hypothetical protein